MKTSTNIEQTNHLFELGYDSSYCHFIKDDMFGPASFTISDFFEILPPIIEEDWHDGLIFNMFYDDIVNKWVVGYYATSDKDRGIQFTKIAEELIDALYELVCWYKMYINS